MVLSILIPVEPVIFIGILIQAIRKKLHEEKLIVHILLFAAHIIMFLLFLGLFAHGRAVFNLNYNIFIM
jgi:hypothetical protein